MVICGDARVELSKLDADSVNCCVTSPPYWGLRDYGVVGQLGLEPTPEEYTERMVEVFREVRRVLRADGTCWLNLGDSYTAPGGGYSPNAPSNKAGSKQPTQPHAHKDIKKHFDYGNLKPKDLCGIPWRVAFALQASGWYLRSEIIWSKANPMPESVTDRPTKAHEQIFLLAKSERYYYDSEAIAEPCGGFNGSSFTTGKTHDARAHLAPVSKRERVESSKRNKRSVWTVTTDPFSASELGCGTAYIASANCPEHGLRACPETWRKAANGEQQAVGKFRIDSNDARLAVAPLSVSSSSFFHTHHLEPSSGQQMPESTGESKMLIPSPSCDNPSACDGGLHHTKRTLSSHGMPLDSWDSLARLCSQPATDRSKRKSKKAREHSTSSPYTISAGSSLGIERTEESPETSSLRLGIPARKPSEDFSEGGSALDPSAQIQVHSSRRCTCKSILSDHFAVFPPALIEPCIKAGCPAGGVVLDPFAGSGTTLEVARRMDCKFIGIELNPEYCKLIEKRLRQEVLVW